MSDEIFEVATLCVDVAALGQDYSDRVDGERILLALPREIAAGDEVRFVVILVDGTPAFAGAGRCIQVSDQGLNAGMSRYETLLDSLAFDERSAPVYEYIVAVRQLAYQQAGYDEGMEASPEQAEAEAGGAEAHVEIAADAPEEYSAQAQDVEEETAQADEQSQAADGYEVDQAEMHASSYEQPDEPVQQAQEASEPHYAQDAQDAPDAQYAQYAQDADAQDAHDAAGTEADEPHAVEPAQPAYEYDAQLTEQDEPFAPSVQLSAQTYAGEDDVAYDETAAPGDRATPLEVSQSSLPTPAPEPALAMAMAASVEVADDANSGEEPAAADAVVAAVAEAQQDELADEPSATSEPAYAAYAAEAVTDDAGLGMQEPEPAVLQLSSSQPEPAVYTSIVPEPLRTGILTRPAIAAHWAPAAPRPPQRSLRPTGFQSTPGPLAVPKVPPRPALDRSQWVERAPVPTA